MITDRNEWIEQANRGCQVARYLQQEVMGHSQQLPIVVLGEPDGE
jgi:hypothetical protein